jgi:hypothetical protein
VISILIYNIVGFFCIFFVRVSEKIKVVRKIGLVLSFLVLFTLSGLRYNVGTDYESYVGIFENIANDAFVIIEPGFYLFCKLFSNFNNGHLYVFLVCSFITNIFLFTSLAREKILFLGLFFSFTFGFVFLSNNLIRQALAIVIFFYSIKYIYSKRLLSFLFCIAIGSLFHYSAILLLPLFWVDKIRFKNFFWFLIISVSYLLSFLDWFNFWLVKLIIFFPKYSGYLTWGGEEKTAVNSGITMFIIYILNLFIVANYNDSVANERFKMYYKLYLIGVSLAFLTLKVSIVFRFSYYLTSLIIFVIPLMVKGMDNNRKKHIFQMLVMLMSLLFWFKSFWFNDHGALPYNSLLLW